MPATNEPATPFLKELRQHMKVADTIATSDAPADERIASLSRCAEYADARAHKLAYEQERRAQELEVGT